jgi:histidinol phosphatase-like PHP family hydrolase
MAPKKSAERPKDDQPREGPAADGRPADVPLSGPPARDATLPQAASNLLDRIARWERRHGQAFRASAYTRAAKAVERLSGEDFADLVDRGALRTISGIGPSIEHTLTRFVLYGEVPSKLGPEEAEQEARDGAAPDDLDAGSHLSIPPNEGPFFDQPDLHCHTTWSDGTLSLEGAVVFARRMGAVGIGISDHSASLRIANGLRPDEVRSQWRDIDRLRTKYPDLVILKGTECDIKRNGELDHPEEILAGFDYVIGSLHSQLKLPAREQTQRLLAALENPRLTILGHPTNRVPSWRPRSEYDLDAVFESAAAHHVALEVNGNPGRKDLDSALAKRALSLGAKLSLGSDGHSAEEMLSIFEARRLATKAGARPGDLVNRAIAAKVLGRSDSKPGLSVPPPAGRSSKGAGRS